MIEYYAIVDSRIWSEPSRCVVLDTANTMEKAIRGLRLFPYSEIVKVQPCRDFMPADVVTPLGFKWEGSADHE